MTKTYEETLKNREEMGNDENTKTLAMIKNRYMEIVKDLGLNTKDQNGNYFSVFIDWRTPETNSLAIHKEVLISTDIDFTREQLTKDDPTLEYMDYRARKYVLDQKKSLLNAIDTERERIFTLV